MTIRSRTFPSAVLAIGVLLSVGSGSALAAGDGSTNNISGVTSNTSSPGATQPPAASSAVTPTTTPTHHTATRRTTHRMTTAGVTSPASTSNPSQTTVDGNSGNAKGSSQNSGLQPVPGVNSAGSPNGGK